MSIQTYLPQSSMQDPPEFGITSASQRQLPIFPFLHNLNPPRQGVYLLHPITGPHALSSSLSSSVSVPSTEIPVQRDINCTT